MPPHLLRAALSLPVEPAIPWLWHQYGENLPLGERQQGAVGSSRLVGHPRPHGSSAAPKPLTRGTRNASLGGRSWRGNAELCPAELWNNLQKVIKDLTSDVILTCNYINESQAVEALSNMH